MKKLEELGISPAPWNVKHHPEESSDEFEVLSADGRYVGPIGIGYGISKSMANLIAAAPDLYDALRDAVNSYCEGCNDFINKDQQCDPCECPARKWRAALAKAVGEEVADGK